MRLLGRLLGIGLLLACLCFGPALAAPAASTAPQQIRGLVISPLRQELSVDSGGTITKSIVIANLTDNPLTIDIFSRQFSVTDYNYDYQFNKPKTDWLHPGVSQLALEPGKSKTIPFSLSVPAGTAPGGYYYTLFASSTLSTGGLKSTVQAASLIYITVNGKLAKTGQIGNIDINRFNFGSTINYKADATNTGNVHYFAYVSGSVHGALTNRQNTPTTYLLMPEHVRRIKGAIAPPVLPGIYRVQVAYKTDSGEVADASKHILYLPFWSIALVLIILVGLGTINKRQNAVNQSKDQ